MNRGPSEASIGFVSTYPPTICGLASYTASLVDGISNHRRSRSGLGVVDFAHDKRASTSPDVAFHHRVGDPWSLDQAARVLNTYDSVSIQHEFGIFGGADGDEVIDLISEITVPTAITFHTVLDDPSRRQRGITDRLTERADRMVVMSRTALERLTRRYGVDPDRVEVVPHGADPRFAGPSLVTGDRPLVLTWGLIGPGKGLEAAIAAFADLTDLDPAPRYLIAGATHPNVRESAGESYRHGLMALVDRLGLADLIEFDNRYLDRDTLARLVRSADVVLLPYDSVEQVTSGVLVEAIAASKPVIATRFPHAVELLTGGPGLTVPHGDVAGISAALRRLLTDRGLRSRMGHHAQGLADGWYWPSIGRRFDAIMTSIAEAGRSDGASTTSEIRRVAG